ncbi:11845_t:CDS:2 [Racocetra fulgida]|uniref:11845_t:CDS:1 n=1 Tax=Racocetra fulgida TaxID=60492 RepID=A0A9N8ZDI3_9GLOM|nr:11845_t:CDS:2 [Racocetra fulgida]
MMLTAINTSTKVMKPIMPPTIAPVLNDVDVGEGKKVPVVPFIKFVNYKSFKHLDF